MFVCRVSPRRLVRRIGPVTAVVLAGLTVSACQTSGSRQKALFGGASNEITGSISASQVSLSDTQKTAKEWEKDPSNVAIALRYALQLEALGSDAHALTVLQQTQSKNPGNRAVAVAYGKQLSKLGRFAEAVQMLKQAQGLGDPDWRIASALGTVLDGMGYQDKAQEQYQYALKLQPGRVSVMNNLGMSYALGGDLKTAEKTLKTALGREPKNTKVRQNLALVTGLQGRFQEAEKIVSTDLPPNLVSANIQYLRSMLSQQNTWDAIKKQNSTGNARKQS